MTRIFSQLPDGGVVDLDAALSKEFLDFPAREAVAEIPTNGANNDLGFKLSPLEQPWLPFIRASQATSEVHRIFATLPEQGPRRLNSGQCSRSVEAGQ